MQWVIAHVKAVLNHFWRTNFSSILGLCCAAVGFSIRSVNLLSGSRAWPLSLPSWLFNYLLLPSEFSARSKWSVLNLRWIRPKSQGWIIKRKSETIWQISWMVIPQR